VCSAALQSCDRAVEQGRLINPSQPLHLTSKLLDPTTTPQVRPPMPPVYFFVIDVSQAAIGSGLLATAAAAIKACLDK